MNPLHTLHVVIKIFNTPCSFLIDTGAAVSLIRDTTWKRCKPPGSSSLEPWTYQNLSGVEGSPLQVIGSAEAQIEIGG